ncbi:hypothetical protein RB200_30020 [Streptomyces sp. PmtG]
MPSPTPPTSRATTGTRVPRLPVVEAYARACGASVRHARGLWRAARYAEHRQRDPRAGVPRPDRVYDRDALIHALQQLYYKAGAMPMDEMERRAGAHGELPHSTVQRMLAGKSMLDLDQLFAFLRVCEVTGGEWEQWRLAWHRAWRRRAVEREAARLARALRRSAHRRPHLRERARPGARRRPPLPSGRPGHAPLPAPGRRRWAPACAVAAVSRGSRVRSQRNFGARHGSHASVVQGKTPVIRWEM